MPYQPDICRGNCRFYDVCDWAISCGTCEECPAKGTVCEGGEDSKSACFLHWLWNQPDRRLQDAVAGLEFGENESAENAAYLIDCLRSAIGNYKISIIVEPEYENEDMAHSNPRWTEIKPKF